MLCPTTNASKYLNDQSKQKIFINCPIKEYLKALFCSVKWTLVSDTEDMAN